MLITIKSTSRKKGLNSKRVQLNKFDRTKKELGDEAGCLFLVRLFYF